MKKINMNKVHNIIIKCVLLTTPLQLLLLFYVILSTTHQPVQSSPQKYTVIDGSGNVLKDMYFVKEAPGRIVFKDKYNKSIVINGNSSYYEQ